MITPFQTTCFSSTDSNVFKYVFTKGKDIAVESVLYRYGSFSERTVICCSTQCGCPVGCRFCGTGRFFVRNLTAQEIIEQVTTVLSHIDCDTKDIHKFQIMFMSMGEPFLNYEQLKEAIKDLSKLYPNAQLLVSTSAPAGFEKHIEDFAQLTNKIPQIGLQFSVHESLNERRNALISSKTSSLEQIAEAGEKWATLTHKKPFYNYCVHEHNSTIEDAERLVNYFNPAVWETTLSVICEKDESVKNSIDRQLEMIQKFADEMTSRGASLRIFNPAGQDDIGGGCGQLWFFQKWLKDRKQEN